MTLPLLFGSALFVSAVLLFSIQPMFARMVLPLLGGAPAVWITCMLFFQAVLLAGYGYAHLAARMLSRRWQVALHVVLLLLAFLVLPPAVPAGMAPPAAHSPVPWLLNCLVAAVGLPLLVLSASAPLLQRWLVDTGHPGGRDPYFLYAASNLGSLIALLAYPIAIEPHLRLAEQSRLWAVGYGVMAGFALACALVVWRAASAGNAVESRSRESPTVRLSPGQVARWLALSSVTSSLMLGLTTYLTTDISPIPLLWVGPLALYLLTFVLVFASRALVSEHMLARALPLCVLLLVMTMAARAAGPLWLLVALHVVTFFVAAMLCHGQLAASRPPTTQLTAFYLILATGGVLGGVFNALLAPYLFPEVVEYPLAIVLACLLRPSPRPEGPRARDRWLALAVPVVIIALVPGLAVAARALSTPDAAIRIIVLGPPVLMCFALRDHRAAFALGIAAIMLSSAVLGDGGHVLHRERSFFGVSRVSVDTQRGRRVLWSGSTAHGFQSLDPALEREPLAYYHRTGPLGQIFGTLARDPGRAPVAIVGLGAGSMACYGDGQRPFAFFEIDPAVERIARDPRYFTFLRTCGATVTVALGDARSSLERAPDHRYGLLILDAFSSDAIPVHLLTREAVALYLRKVADGGLLAFHISNRYVDLEPVLAGVVRERGLVGLLRRDHDIPASDRQLGRTESDWAVIARRSEDLGALSRTSGWSPLTPGPGYVWSDDFSSVLGIVRWR